MVCGELHISRKVRDREAIAFFLLNLGNVRAAVLLLVHNPAEELFEDFEVQKEQEEEDWSSSQMTDRNRRGLCSMCKDTHQICWF